MFHQNNTPTPGTTFGIKAPRVAGRGTVDICFHLKKNYGRYSDRETRGSMRQRCRCWLNILQLNCCVELLHQLSVTLQFTSLADLTYIDHDSAHQPTVVGRKGPDAQFGAGVPTSSTSVALPVPFPLILAGTRHSSYKPPTSP